MTKDELIALARDGKAHIEAAYTITRYCISRRERKEGAAASCPLIFMSISNEDGSVYKDEAYFTDDGEDDIDLTETETEILRAAIESRLVGST